MNKRQVEVEVPFEFCEKCKMCAIVKNQEVVCEISGFEEIITKHYCKNEWACSNAVYLYKQSLKEDKQ